MTVIARESQRAGDGEDGRHDDDGAVAAAAAEAKAQSSAKIENGDHRMFPPIRRHKEAQTNSSQRDINNRRASLSPGDRMIDLTEERVVQYLRDNPSVLENYVTGPNVSPETFQKWVHRRNNWNHLRRDARKVFNGAWGVIRGFGVPEAHHPG
ncbi:hypothetical protein OSTOST_19639 [Ostertagia ostertagi]